MAESAESQNYGSITSPIPPPFSPTSPTSPVTAAFSPDSNISQPISDDNSTRLQKIDSEQEEIKQTAVNALHQNSILAMHVIASGESPARTRLRMLRYLTGLPQPENKNFITSTSSYNEGPSTRD
ncbi:unnamed protein product [Rhizophagus irregularis]|uniref:Uncharacterized protein n=1 Tax=Rhizophagus irregularis TaxID=588596 RepID=A0A2I1G7B5_9GLOM|nr:hypothetical protein RhiirA4_506060 [Rhizophagus irregularis]CAB4445666.1 unnamed protein product [Rhizophagus irregularis]